VSGGVVQPGVIRSHSYPTRPGRTVDAVKPVPESQGSDNAEEFTPMSSIPMLWLPGSTMPSTPSSWHSGRGGVSCLNMTVFSAGSVSGSREAFRYSTIVRRPSS